MPDVEVLILGKKYSFDTPGNPDLVKAAANLLDRKLKTVADVYGMISNERMILLSALNLAEELLRVKHETKLDRVEDFLKGLSDRLELSLREESTP